MCLPVNFRICSYYNCKYSSIPIIQDKSDPEANNTDDTAETTALKPTDNDGGPDPAESVSSPPSTVTNEQMGETITTSMVDFDEHVKELPTLTDIHHVILDCSTMSYVDSVGVKVLKQVTHWINYCTI